jgi:hypothetical protein
MAVGGYADGNAVVGHAIAIRHPPSAIRHPPSAKPPTPKAAISAAAIGRSPLYNPRMQSSTRGDERREFQRLHLASPIQGTFGSVPVVIQEIGILGARVQHNEPLESDRGDLRFTSHGESIAMRCEVVRTINGVSGLRFIAALENSGDSLRSMLAQLVTQEFARRYDDSATKMKVRRLVDGDKTVRGTDAQFLSYRFEDGGWKRRHVFLPEQPSIGFTVARGEDTDEMRRLCEVYEASDEEGRRLIRLFAELSVSSVLQIPPSS